jgi:hypothetical protein
MAMVTLTAEQFLLGVFALATSANLVSAAMFWARVRRPAWSRPLGVAAIALGAPALALAVAGATSGISWTRWLFPLLYAIFAAVTLLLDFILKVEFRQPRRASILVPFLILYYFPLVAMWGMLWDSGLVYWAVNGASYLAMLFLSLWAVRKGAG